MQPTMMDVSQIRLLQLVSPLLPVGAFAYSQVLESAVDSAIITDEETTFAWVNGILQHSITQLDLSAMHYILEAFEEDRLSTVQALNDLVYAFRETSELRAESYHLARALLRLLAELHDNEQGLLAIEGKLDWVTAFSFACHLNKIPHDQSMLAYAWSWCENQVQAAIKLVPLGQTAGQKLLVRLGDELPAVIAQAKQKSIDELGASSPNLSILSSQHEQQYSRLFRS